MNCVPRQLEPLWDEDIRPGAAFSDAIKGLITHAHIFMPLITENSQKRPWVHQETGYAMALNIPVLPVAVEGLPGEMAAQLQAVCVKKGLLDVDERLGEVSFEQVVFPPPARPRSIVEVADWPEKRVELIVEYAKRVVELGRHGRVRQRGRLSTFSIPDADLDDDVWAAREAPDARRSRYYHDRMREQRRIFERHARAEGCRLILDHTLDRRELGDEVTAVRFKILSEFLCSMDGDQAQVILAPRSLDGQLTIVGNWFVAESLTPHPGKGYRQTIFTWHAPTVSGWVRTFDEEFERLCKESTVNPEQSLRRTIDQIKEIS